MTCAYCNGLGEDEDARNALLVAPCPYCRGTGEVPVMDEDGPQRDDEQERSAA